MFKRLILIALTGVALASTLSACVVAPVGRPGYVHDRDRDGVPNRYDNRPDNPYRH